MALTKNSIFISYRKDDSGGWAAKLADELRAIVGKEAVFMDDSIGIPYGAEWPDRITIALHQCRVYLPVIAPAWHQEPNVSRLKSSDDWVRKELFHAHDRQASILRVPVMVNEAATLDPDLFSDNAELQDAVSSLMNQQGLRLDRSPEHWPDKISDLVSLIETYLGVSLSCQDKSTGSNISSQAPKTLYEAILKTIWNQGRGRKIFLITMFLICVGVFSIWNSLPESAKTKFLITGELSIKGLVVGSNEEESKIELTIHNRTGEEQFINNIKLVNSYENRKWLAVVTTQQHLNFKTRSY